MVWRVHHLARLAAPAVLAALSLADPLEARQRDSDASASPARGGTPVTSAPTRDEKAGYTLFRPTPRDSMRDMSTDRPDQTETPYTVDAGHFQLEMDFLTATVDRVGDATRRVIAWSVAPVNLKLGLLNNLDLQVTIDPYQRAYAGDPDATSTRPVAGFGNVATRLKMNLWGNDGGRTACAVMPFLKWPLPASGLRNGRIEGGVIFPFAVSVAEGWDVGAMTELDLVARPAGGHDAQWVNSITVGHSLTGKLGMYVEVLAAGFVGRQARWLGQFDVGWTYALRDSVRLDWGSNLGVAGPAPALQPFVGLSVRF